MIKISKFLGSCSCCGNIAITTQIIGKFSLCDKCKDRLTNELLDGKTYSKAKHKRNFSPWTVQERELLKGGKFESYKEAAEKLGRTRGAIYIECQRLEVKLGGKK